MSTKNLMAGYIYKKDLENPGSYYAIAKGPYPDEYIQRNDSETPGNWGRYTVSRMVGRSYGFGLLKEAEQELELRLLIDR